MALLSVTLRDFVLVRELEIDFSAGFTVLTGETGAGKSLLIDALQFVMGTRADASTIRTEAERCDVCALFELSPLHQERLLEFAADETELLLRRTMDRNGRSRAWINGVPATASQLRRIGDVLVDIYGQHSWQSLERAETCRGLLDSYAQLDTGELSATWRRWRDRAGALVEAQTSQDKRRDDSAQLEWHLAELDRLAPAVGEWDQLQQQHKRQSSAQDLLETAHRSLALLTGEPSGALTQIARARQLLQTRADVEPEFAMLSRELDGCLAVIGEVNRTLQAYGQRGDLEPETLQQLDQRISAWISLSRRHRVPQEQLPEFHAKLKEQRLALDTALDLDALGRAERAAYADWHMQAQRVSAVRKAAALRLESSVSTSIRSLGMMGGRFQIELKTLDAPGENGLEEVRFLLSPYPEGDMQTLGKIASGGELSRIALAIAACTSQLGVAGTLIFDEVDTGIGGAVAERVGRLLQQLAADRQVFAITHLPQVASKGARHIVVRKVSTDNAVVSQIDYVDGEQRVREIARMIAGEQITNASLNHASELLST